MSTSFVAVHTSTGIVKVPLHVLSAMWQHNFDGTFIQTKIRAIKTLREHYGAGLSFRLAIHAVNLLYGHDDAFFNQDEVSTEVSTDFLRPDRSPGEESFSI